MVRETWVQSQVVIIKTQKMVIDASLLNTHHYKVRIKSKWSNIGKGVAPSLTPRCHHHHVVPLARISLTLSRHFSLSFFASGRSSGLHPVSSLSCWMYVRASRPAFARPYVGVHRSTSLMSSSLLLQQCPACLVRLTWIVFVMRGRWRYSWCHVGCCRQDLFKLLAAFLCNCRLASSPAV